MTLNATESQDHISSYRTYFFIWAALMLLLVATIAVAKVEVSRYSVLLNLFIATVKAGLVLFFFMHLKYENWFLKGVLFMVLVMLAIVIGLTFSDVWYR
ncbi:MAG: cytochrome C oxidase subunit IV family protein [Nitrospiraceae bacterium]|nr:cytochrome C oxidase subunit IV family protein [Nitrospiraceae bacterium]